MFSPIFCTSASRASCKSPPVSASMSASRSLKARSSTVSTKAWKWASRATKSVSLLTSMMTPRLPSSATRAATTPSAAVRPAFLAACMPLDLRSSSMAASMSPPASTRAFLHSIMPRPVRSRSSLTIAAVTAAIVLFLHIDWNGTTPAGAAPLISTHSKKGAVPPSLQILLARPRSTLPEPAGHAALLLGGRLGLLGHGFGQLFGDFAPVGLVAGGEHGLGHGRGVQTNGADGIVVAGDDVVHALGVGVGVHHAHHRNAQLVGFLDGNALVVHIDDKQRIGQAAHVLDTADGALQLLHVPAAHQCFLLGQLVEGAVLSLSLQVAQAADGLPNGLVVGEHAAQPAMADIGHAGTLGLLLDYLARRALGADEENLVAVGRQPPDELQGVVEGRDGALQVDDVNLVAGPEDVGRHARVPEAGLVAKVHTGLQHLAHADLSRHEITCLVRVGPPRTPGVNPPQRAPGHLCRHVCVIAPKLSTESGERDLYHRPEPT